MRNLLFIPVIAMLLYACEINHKPNYLKLGNMGEIQRFTVDQTTDTVIEGAKRTLIEIRKNSFVDKEGYPVKYIEVLLKEFYSPMDFVSNRLSTMTSDGRLLRSSGMIQIRANSEGEEVYLKEGATVKLGFPRVQESRVANLFQGIEGANAEIVWEKLEPVHIDTFVYRTVIIEALSYGVEKLTINLFAVVGYDTVDINETNYEQFKKFKAIDTGFNYFESDSTSGLEGRSYFSIDNYYTFQTADLGFVNCDIFIDEELFPFIVKTDKSNSDVFIVLNGMNSVIYPDSTSEDKRNYFFRLPDDIPISVVAYSKVKDVNMFDLASINSSQQTIELTLKPTNLEKIDEAIGQLN
jgi:hypothetical protein